MRPRLHSRTLLAILAVGVASAEPPANNSITAVRHWTLGDVTRIVVETTADFEFQRDRVPNPDRLFFDIPGTRVRLGKKGIVTFAVNDPRLKQIRVAQTMPNVARVVFDLQDSTEYTASMLSNPPRLIVELKKTSSTVADASQSSPGASAELTQGRTTPGPARPPDSPATGIAKSQGTVSQPGPARQIAATNSEAHPTATAPAAGDPSATPVAAARTPAGSARTTSPRVRPTADPAPSESRRANPKPSELAAPGGSQAAVKAAEPPAEKRSTPLPANLGASQSMTRVLGLKIGRIVLDAGHGGHDTGTIGPGGLMEKDLSLDICKRLGDLIETRLGAEVIHTRTDDTFIPLERRTEIANESKADLFLSIHANSSPLASSSGVETYYLNFSTSREAMQVAARENASSQKTVYELKDLLQKIALQDKVEESRQFASRIQQSVYAAAAKSNSRARNRGVRKAPFVVLIGASMPSVLAEVGFLSNPRDEALFKRNDFRQKIAEALYQGLSRYASTLSQFQVARN